MRQLQDMIGGKKGTVPQRLFAPTKRHDRGEEKIREEGICPRTVPQRPFAPTKRHDRGEEKRREVRGSVQGQFHRDHLRQLQDMIGVKREKIGERICPRTVQQIPFAPTTRHDRGKKRREGEEESKKIEVPSTKHAGSDY